MLRRSLYVLSRLPGFVTGRIRGLRTPSHFSIKPGYRHRARVAYFDDTGLRDEYQREVYERAARLFRESDCMRVLDIGCGSGYKLVQHFGPDQTIGFDLPPTVAYLRATYPGRRWEDVTALDGLVRPTDLLICADVIEHLPNPDDLMQRLRRHPFRYLVLSTPDRATLRGWVDYGPPENPAHAREWSRTEFRQYVDRYFEVIEHGISNRQQATQLLICRHRSGASGADADA